jgi:ketosteroid isomerase-like protein
MDHEKQSAPNPAVEELFNRLKSDLGQAKPGQDAVNAALQAIQRLAVEVDSEQAVKTAREMEGDPGPHTCVICGAPNREENRFCAACGTPILQAPAQPPDSPVPPLHPEPQAQPGQHPGSVPGPHHYHHHYHHHYFSSMQPVGPEVRAAGSSAQRDTRLRPPLPGAPASRAETAARRMTQDWTLACNTRQLDSLVDLYAADALVLRSNAPAVRGTTAIRELFFAALEAGLGEVEMEPLRTELLGDVGYEAGRCKMLVPGAMGKRREERGKYLIILTRQEGEWKIVADCWSSDLSLGASAEPARADPPSPLSPARPPRKTA